MVLIAKILQAAGYDLHATKRTMFQQQHELNSATSPPTTFRVSNTSSTQSQLITQPSASFSQFRSETTPFVRSPSISPYLGYEEPLMGSSASNFFPSDGLPFTAISTEMASVDNSPLYSSDFQPNTHSSAATMPLFSPVSSYGNQQQHNDYGGVSVPVNLDNFTAATGCHCYITSDGYVVTCEACNARN